MKFKPFKNGKKSRLWYGRVVDDILFAGAIIGLITVFLDVGNENKNHNVFYDHFYQITLLLFASLFAFRSFLLHFRTGKIREMWVSIVELIFLCILLVAQLNFDFELFSGLSEREYLQLAIVIIFFTEISSRSLALERIKVNPPLLFISSFILIILLGTFTLMLPISSKVEMRFIDALFTSTSAVCVTGLTVLDTGNDFTFFGQNVILLLISAGGLGVMTFTSFFGLFFKNESSFRNQMIYKDFMGEENMRKVYSTIIRIVSFTIVVEIVGTLTLFFCLSPKDFSDAGQQMYFAAFHSISAFNNAGFGLKSTSLYDPVLRNNYSFQTVIALLIIFGGIGFYIAFNVVKYFKERIKSQLKNIVFDEPQRHTPWIVNMNTKVVLITTFILLIVGTVIFYFTDYHQALSGHTGVGKCVGAFFMSVTPRTAGFNNIDLLSMSREGFLLTIFLMWIGGSPGSTAGGIKTSTFAIATLGIVSIARGHNRIEIGGREVGIESLLRASIVIFLSLIALTFSILSLEYLEPDKSLSSIVFECFSALGTVGLSLGITSSLTDVSKFIIVLTMFVGRVGVYTILLGVLKKAVDARFYRYPVENIIIT